MLARLHLIRHGEVHNPRGLVYADLPGFGLSDLGREQAAAAAAHLAGTRPGLLRSSPLERALETANAVAAATGTPVTRDERLTEWRLGECWAGVEWSALPQRFPGELEAYLEHPDSLGFAPESIAQVAARMSDLIEDLGRSHPGASAAIVSHQDPIQALRLTLTGRPLASLQQDKPEHACIITLAAVDRGWSEEDCWCPQQRSAAFPPVGV